MTDIQEKAREDYVRKFHHKGIYPNFGGTSLDEDVWSFIATAIKERDEYHKAIRAKELGELRAKIVRASNHEQIKSGDADPWEVTQELLFILDELIEKP